MVMPEYLSPGVYIEELPPQLRAIEGVSTSIAGFVGPAARGPVPGFPLPFTPAQPLVLNPSPAPSLVTSFSGFVQQYGYPLPLPDPNSNAFLGYAVKGFFDNGGQACYVSRVLPNNPATPATNATYGMVRLNQGVVLNLADDANATDTSLELNTLRGISVGSTLTFYHKNGSLWMNAAGTAALQATVSAYNTASITAQLTGAIGVALPASDTYAIPSGYAMNGEGPAFWACNPGQWSSQISVNVAPTRRRTVPISLGAAANAVEIQVASTSGFYNGAIVEIDNGTSQVYNVVASIGAGFLKLAGQLGVAVAANAATVRIVEIDITITDPTPAVPVVETYLQLTWNPNATANHYATAINAQSQLVFVQPPNMAGLNGSELPALSSQPVTFNGWAINVTDSTNAVAEIGSLLVALQALAQSVSAMNTAATTAAAALPVTDPTVLAAQGAISSLNATVATADAIASAGANNAVRIAAAINAAVAAAIATLSPANNLIALVQTNAPTAAALSAAGSACASAAAAANSLITSATTLAPFATSLLQALTAAIGTLSTDVATLSITAGPFPLAANAPAITSVLTDQAAVLNAAANLTPIADAVSSGIALNASAVLTTILSASTNAEITQAVNQANAAVATAITAASFSIPNLNNESTAVSTAVAAAVLVIQNAQSAAAADLPRLGSDGANPSADDDYVGNDNGPGTRSGILALQDVEEVSIIAAPGRTGLEVQNALINQCEQLNLYRFAVLDGLEVSGSQSINDVLVHRDSYDTSYAAYYVPWLQITLNNQNVFIPPSGHVVGIYAATDNTRGVWKAPANVVVQSISGLETYLTKAEQDILNPAGVNAIRRFAATARVWGARTVSSDTSLMYVNVRRTLIFLEDSIDQGTQWVVFEPNTPDTWDRLTDSVTAFLTTQWASGALFGAKPEDSFFVRCDETTMTADDIQNGRLICLIGVAIVRPAEFVIFRIEQITGYANQS
jgi:uncharacterized protein